MAAIMAVVAYRELRKSKRGQPLASLAALGILGLAAFVNNGSSWDARADLVLGTVSISDANATQVVMSEDNIYEVTNTSGVTVQITGVTPSIDSSVGDIPGQVQYNAYRPICTVGSSLAAGAKRSGCANLNNFLSGNSEHEVWPRMAEQTGVSDGEEVSTTHAAYAHTRIQGASSPCRLA
jgi:hypothetical protein